jgi:acetyltransferase-like isoleucine patch superfamily enzyme
MTHEVVRTEGFLSGIKNRILEKIARGAPGAQSFRPLLHRWRGVNMGKQVWIGYDCIIETAKPHLVTIRDGATIGIRNIIIAHFRDWERPVVIEEEAFLGPGVIVLPNVVIGRGAVVAAGSVVTTSVPPHMMVRGNPARPVAIVGKPPNAEVSYQEFSASLRPLEKRSGEKHAV